MNYTAVKKTFIAALLSIAAGFSTAVLALDVNLTDHLSYVEVEHGDGTVRIQRIQNQDNVLTDGFAKTSRMCPPFCIQPMSVAPGVTTVGETEIFRFMDPE